MLVMDIQCIYYYLRRYAMDYEKLWDDLVTAAKTDMDYQRALKDVENLEAHYLSVCSRLCSEDKAAIENYIAACEELGDCMTLIAYRLGIENK